MLCSKDLVKRAIEFRKPERVPYNFDSNRTPVTAERYGDDFERVFSTPPGDTFPIARGNDRYVNEFGVVYHRPGVTFGAAVEFPLLDLSRVPSYRVPDFSRPAGGHGGGFMAKTYPQPADAGAGGHEAIDGCRKHNTP